MASWIDSQPINLNPYIGQTNIDAYVNVERQKQLQYDQNTEAIDTVFSQLTNLPVDSKYSQYVNQSVSQLNEGVKKVSGADFSNRQLVSKIEGAASQIAKDPIIQAGILSASNMKYNQDMMREDKKSGKLTPQNEQYFYDKYNKWKTNSDLRDAFNDQYVQFYDINDRLNKDIASAHLDKNEWDELPKDENGNISPDIILRKSKEGLLSSKVAAIVNNALMDPRVQQQAQINGWYQYRNYTPQGLKDIAYSGVRYLSDQLSDLQGKLSAKKSLSQTDQANYTQAIADAKQRLTNAQINYNQFSKLVDSGNLENAYTQLYSDNLLQSTINTKSWESNSSKAEVSPYFDAQMKRANYELDVAKEKFDQFNANRDYQFQTYKFQQEYNQKEREMATKAAKEANEKGAGGVPTVYDPANIPGDAGINVGRQSFQEEQKSLDNNRSQLFAQISSSMDGYYRDIPYNKLYIQDRDGNYIPNPEYSKNPNFQEAIKTANWELNNLYSQGNIQNDLKKTAQLYYDLTSLSQQRKELFNNIERNFKKTTSGAFNITNKTVGTYDKDGQLVNITDNDVMNYWLWRNAGSDTEKSNLEKDISSKFGDINKFNRFMNIERLSDKGNEVGKVFKGANTINRLKKTISVGRWISGEGELFDSRYLKQPDGYNAIQLYKDIDEKIKQNNNLKNAVQSREQAYKDLQGQMNYNTATFLPSKPEDQKTINTLYSKAFADISDEQRAKGNYADIPEWLDPTKSANLSTNTYRAYRDNSGQPQLVVQKNIDGKMESRTFPTSEKVFQQLQLFNNPKEDEFNTVVQPFLNLHANQQTVADMNSDDAFVNSIERRNVGKYSVGFQFKAMNGGYVPYLYITNRQTGERKTGIRYDPSVLAKNPSLTPEMRQIIENTATSVIQKQDLLDKIRDNQLFTEDFISLLLANN